ncbi:hypothetical protein [Streptococcus sp. HF-100]|uniref:hypothetical protein n=1 Tax=Streptococcus sp. HF-100 TaxID=2785791 RepID=UPI00189E89F2|nr:hypothetical protein [Streptococcus sp. HF-100]MBF7075941.1 hypothetical protein [Streptococcus sp. HF-100]
MSDLDSWLARTSVAVGLAVAISKEARSWYVVHKEQNKKAKNARKYPTRKR